MRRGKGITKIEIEDDIVKVDGVVIEKYDPYYLVVQHPDSGLKLIAFVISLIIMIFSFGLLALGIQYFIEHITVAPKGTISGLFFCLASIGMGVTGLVVIFRKLGLV